MNKKSPFHTHFFSDPDAIRYTTLASGCASVIIYAVDHSHTICVECFECNIPQGSHFPMSNRRERNWGCSQDRDVRFLQGGKMSRQRCLLHRERTGMTLWKPPEKWSWKQSWNYKLTLLLTFHWNFHLRRVWLDISYTIHFWLVNICQRNSNIGQMHGPTTESRIRARSENVIFFTKKWIQFIKLWNDLKV